MTSLSAELFCIVWLFFLGATLGSFLNVVVFRVPRRRTLLGSSHCPRCQTTIDFFDNVPIVSWYVLRGRCRHCGAPISTRYPMIEFVMGAVLLLLGVVWIALDGYPVPAGEFPRYPGFAWHLFEPKSAMLSMYAGHVALMGIVLACALIDFDGQPIPGSIVGALAIVGALMIAAAPRLPTAVGIDFGPLGSHVATGWCENVVGLALGIMAGMLFEVATRGLSAGPEPATNERIMIWAITLGTVGGYAAASVFLLAGIAAAVGMFVQRGLFTNSCGLLFIGLVVNAAAWSWFAAAVPGWPWAGQTIFGATCWTLGGVGLLLLTAHRRQPIATIPRSG